MNEKDAAEKMIENMRLHCKIIGIYGYKDGKLVEPSNPDCDVVVVIRSLSNKIIYDIEQDKFYVLDRQDKHIDDKTKNHFKSAIFKYLNDPENIKIEKDDEVGQFDKMLMPLIRRVYPKISSGLMSVQPMTTPIGLVEYLKKKKED